VCGCDLNDYPLVASGASDYTFSIERTDKMDYSVDSDTLFLSQISDEKKNGSYTSWIWVTGTQGTCSASDSIDLNVSMPENDDVVNAIRIYSGRNSSYSNFCASEETNEVSSTTSSTMNSIWFKFQAPSSGKISIDTQGFDDEIYVYDADSYTDLISGLSTSYTLMASNDDRSSSDNTALISNLELEPYKIYWLQLLGNDGETGDCTIDLLSNSLELYPNPSTGEVNLVVSNEEDGTAEVQIVSTIGQVIYSNSFAITKESNHINFQLSSYTSGVYMIVVRMNGSMITRKLILRK
jgi:hypothetical protein